MSEEMNKDLSGEVDMENYVAMERGKLRLKLMRGLAIKRKEILACLPEVFEDDELVIEILEKYVGLLEAFPASIRSCKKFVEIAVNAHYASFAAASDEMRRDEDVARIFFSSWAWDTGRDSSVDSTPWDIMLKKHGLTREFYKELEGEYLETFYLYYWDELRDSKTEALEAIDKAPEVYGRLSEVLRSDRQLALAAVSRNGWLLKYASEEIRSDAEVVWEALKSSSSAGHWVSAKLVKECGGRQLTEALPELLHAQRAVSQKAVIVEGLSEMVGGKQVIGKRKV